MGRANNIFIKFKERIGMKKKVKAGNTSSAVEQITAIMNYINSYAFLSGIEFINDWKVNLRLFVTALANLSLVIIQFYSIHYLYPDIKVVIVLGGTAYATSNITKFAVTAGRHKKFMSLLNAVFVVYNANRSGVREHILKGTCKTILKHCRYVLFGIVFGVALYSFYPVYDITVKGKLTPISPLKFFYIDDQTYVGLFFSSVINIFLITQNLFGTFAISCIFIIYIDVYDSMVSLVEDDFRMFDRMWDRKGQQIAQFRTKRKVAFKNIMVELMDLARYNAFMNELFSVISSVQVAVSYFGIVFVLFGLLADGYAGGIGSGIYFFTELMMLCYIGQLMANTCQRLEVVTYNAEWYRYDNNYQKDLLIALPIFQTMQPIMLANIYPLNFETGLEVVKNIYSILMFLVNALE